MLYVFSIGVCYENVRLEFHEGLFWIFFCGQNQSMLTVRKLPL